jgi:hypothetical protein
MVCAKLDIGPLFGRGFPRPAFPIGTPPPNAQVAPLPAIRPYQHQHMFALITSPIVEGVSLPIFPLGGNLEETLLFCGICC